MFNIIDLVAHPEVLGFAIPLILKTYTYGELPSYYQICRICIE